MFTLTHTMAVNTEKPHLNRDQVWRGLVLKAENPVPFLDAMSACTVIDRGENWLLRDFTLRGEEMQERVTFEPQERVTFTRTKSSAMGTILNEIVAMENGETGRRRAIFGGSARRWRKSAARCAPANWMRPETAA